MSKNNAAGIVGIITTKPRVVMDAPTWAQKVYEAVLEYRRPSGTKDKFFVQFPGQAAGTKKALLNIKKGKEVLIGGEVRTQNMDNPEPHEPRVKICIYAKVIAVNDPPADPQNEVKLCGHICKDPRVATARFGKIAVTSFICGGKQPPWSRLYPLRMLAKCRRSRSKAENRGICGNHRAYAVQRVQKEDAGRKAAIPCHDARSISHAARIRRRYRRTGNRRERKDMLRRPTVGIALDEMSRGHRQTEEFMRFISGMSVKKDSIFIHAARGRIEEQEEAMQQFAVAGTGRRDTQKTGKAYSAKTGLAAGFANGILRAGLITKDELAQLVDMLNKAGSDRLAELDAKRKSVFHSIFKGAVL